MTTKLLGAILVFLGCSGVGFMMVALHRREEGVLRQMITALEFMECELQYRLTPLPQLCRKTADNSDGYIQKVMLALADELEHQIAPDVSTCMHAALQRTPKLPQLLRENFIQLGELLGHFDLPGQMRGIEMVRCLVGQDLDSLCENKDARLRCYQTLGLCAGSALVIVLF